MARFSASTKTHHNDSNTVYSVKTIPSDGYRTFFKLTFTQGTGRFRFGADGDWVECNAERVNGWGGNDVPTAQIDIEIDPNSTASWVV